MISACQAHTSTARSLRVLSQCNFLSALCRLVKELAAGGIGFLDLIPPGKMDLQLRSRGTFASCLW